MDPIADVTLLIRSAGAPLGVDEISRLLGTCEPFVAYVLAEMRRRGILAKLLDGSHLVAEPQSARLRRGLAIQFTELLETVVDCERIWRLDDRLDASERSSRRDLVP